MTVSNFAEENISSLDQMLLSPSVARQWQQSTRALVASYPPDEEGKQQFSDDIWGLIMSIYLKFQPYW